MLRRMALVRTDVSEECIASSIRVKTISELGTMLAVTSNSSKLILFTVMMEVIHYSETSVRTRATRVIPEDGIRTCPAVFPIRVHLNTD
jgi:hypothetical protein